MRGVITWVEVQHGVLGLLEQVLQVDVFSGVAREREVGCHASHRRCCAKVYVNVRITGGARVSSQ